MPIELLDWSFELFIIWQRHGTFLGRFCQNPMKNKSEPRTIHWKSVLKHLKRPNGRDDLRSFVLRAHVQNLGNAPKLRTSTKLDRFYGFLNFIQGFVSWQIKPCWRHLVLDSRDTSQPRSSVGSRPETRTQPHKLSTGTIKRRSGH